MKDIEKILAIKIDFPPRIHKALTELQLRYFGKTYTDDPHITLYLCKYTTPAFTKVVTALRDAKLQGGVVQLKNLRTEQSKNGGKFYFVDIQSADIQRLHRKILRIGNAHRNGLIRAKELARARQGLYSKVEVARLMKYGFTNVLGGFQPHITLGDRVVLNAKQTTSLAHSVVKLKQELIINEVVVGLYNYSNQTNVYSKDKQVTLPLTIKLTQGPNK